MTVNAGIETLHAMLTRKFSLIWGMIMINLLSEKPFRRVCEGGMMAGANQRDTCSQPMSSGRGRNRHTLLYQNNPSPGHPFACSGKIREQVISPLTASH
ncbi:hypothetical protein CEXT_520371 [Caerostris extrusa]|uniref:Uncharacterized protein n=1 Tax=Caerostris extrusa TaxID=172846 RepID=A0AAV4PIW5_CAEEX|nr:hypothetical protein CEXT_520371 [Caerostris extrusa]